MRYSYEFKLKCVEMYREGFFPDTLEKKLLLVSQVLAEICRIR